MKNQNKLAEEIDELISILDEDIDLSCQRVGFMTEGKSQKARYLEEKIRPSIHKRIQKQIEKTQMIFNENKNENGKDS